MIKNFMIGSFLLASMGASHMNASYAAAPDPGSGLPCERDGIVSARKITRPLLCPIFDDKGKSDSF